LQAEIPQQLLVDLKKLENISFRTEAEFKAALQNQIATDVVAEHEEVIINKAFNIKALLVLFAIIGYIAAFAISLGPVMWALLSEIFPLRFRGLAISVVGFFNSLVSFTVTLVFPWELSNLGPAGTFLIYGLLAAIAFIFVNSTNFL